MKSKLVLILLCLFLNSCEKNNDEPGRSISVEIDSDSFRKFRCDGHPMKLKVSKIRDTRCPQNVNCIWGGYVAVNFNLTIHDKLILEDSLCLGCGQGDVPSSLTFGYNDSAYKLQLKEVNPYPGSPNDADPPVVIFQMVGI